MEELENVETMEQEEVIEEIKSYRVRILDEIGYVLDKNGIEVSKEDLNAIGTTKCFDLENNCVVDYDNTKDKELERLQELRAEREPLLIAFDKYKSNVNYGIEVETETDKINIITWYRLLLELNEYAFENVPERVKYYL